MGTIADFGTRAYPYRVTVPPEVGAVSLDTLKAHLRISNCNQDTILQLYLDASINFAEECMGLDLITRTYQSERDFFPVWPGEGYYKSGVIPQTLNTATGNVGFQLRRGPVQSVDLIEYIEEGTVSTFLTVDTSIFYVTIPEAGKFTDILLTPDLDWPEDIEPKQNSIRITFTSGFGDDQKSIPSDIQLAILESAAQMFSNRGDCSSVSCANGLSAMAKAIYTKRRVLNL